MRDCVASRLRLPDLNGIRIECISNTKVDTYLASFLSDCTPAKLKLLWVNRYRCNDTGIKSKFYVDAFSEAARRTTKEVYFHCIDFSAKDLQTVVRAAHNTKRIVFCLCDIHCSSGLDFGADLSYNTKYISFQDWGQTGWGERTTDWKADPSKFSLIVNAIPSSGLKASLQKLNIYWNHTLSKSKVQEQLKAKGMSHISVVEVWKTSLSS